MSPLLPTNVLLCLLLFVSRDFIQVIFLIYLLFTSSLFCTYLHSCLHESTHVHEGDAR